MASNKEYFADSLALLFVVLLSITGIVSPLGKSMATIAAAIKQKTARRRQTAAHPGSAQEAAEAAHARDYLPEHTDINTALYLLSVWKGMLAIWPMKKLRSSSTSSGSRGKRGSSSRSGNSSSSRAGSGSINLQETVLPACELAVSILKTWPPNVAGSAVRGAADVAVPDGAISRSRVSDLMFAVSSQLSVAMLNELLEDSTPLNTADVKFAKQLSASAEVQHLLLLRVAFTCHMLHKQRQGLSPIKIKTAAGVVSGSKEVAAAAAAAEAATGSSSSREAKQQQYLPVPAHHSTVCDLLLAPADALTVKYQDTTHCCVHLVQAITTVAQVSMAAYNSLEEDGLKRWLVCQCSWLTCRRWSCVPRCTACWRRLLFWIRRGRCVSCTCRWCS